MTNASGRSSTAADLDALGTSASKPTSEPNPAHALARPPRPSTADDDTPPQIASSAKRGDTDDHWEENIRDAVRAGRPEEAIRYAYVWLRRNNSAVIRAEASRQGRRIVDQGFCEDVAQDVVTRLWRALTTGRYNDLINPGGFLRVLVRRAIDGMRRPPSDTATPHVPPTELHAPGLDPEQQIGLASAVRDCLQGLTDTDRHVLGVYLTSIDAEEAASRLRVLVEAFYMRLLRARGRLSRCLEQKGYTNEELLHGLS